MFLQHVTPLYIFALSLHFSGGSSLPSVLQATGIIYGNTLVKEFVLATAVLTDSGLLGIGQRDECCKCERAQNLKNCQFALPCICVLDSSDVHALHPSSLFL